MYVLKRVERSQFRFRLHLTVNTTSECKSGKERIIGILNDTSPILARDLKTGNKVKVKVKAAKKESKRKIRGG